MSKFKEEIDQAEDAKGLFEIAMEMDKYIDQLESSHIEISGTTITATSKDGTKKLYQMDDCRYHTKWATGGVACNYPGQNGCIHIDKRPKDCNAFSDCCECRKKEGKCPKPKGT